MGGGGEGGRCEGVVCGRGGVGTCEGMGGGEIGYVRR